MPTATGQQSPLRDTSTREGHVKGPTKVEASKTIYEEPTKVTHIEQIKKTKEIVEPGRTIIEKLPTEVYEGRSPVTIERQAREVKGRVEVFREGEPHETTRVEREKILHVEPVRRVEVENIKKEQWEEDRGRLVEEPAPRMLHSPAKVDQSHLGQLEHGLQQTHISGEPTTIQRENLGISSTQGGLPQQTTGLQTTGIRGESQWRGDSSQWRGEPTEWKGESTEWKGESTGLQRSGEAPTTTGGYVPVVSTPHGYPPTGYGEYQRYTSADTTRQYEGAYMGGTTGTSSQWSQPTGPTTSGYPTTTGTSTPLYKGKQGWTQEVHSSMSEQPHLHPPGSVPKPSTKEKLRGITHKMKDRMKK